MDINKLTLGELAQIEELGQAPIGYLQDETKPKFKLLTALAYVIRKRENPKLTLIEVQNTPISEIESLLNEINEVSDTEKKDVKGQLNN